MTENPHVNCPPVHDACDCGRAWQEGFEAGRQTLLEESIELARLARQLAAKEIPDAPVTPPTRGGRATATVCTDCDGNKRVVCECVPQIHEVAGIEEMVGAVDCPICGGEGDNWCHKCGGTGGVIANPIEPPGGR